jgi:hypothetical protein
LRNYKTNAKKNINKMKQIRQTKYATKEKQIKKYIDNTINNHMKNIIIKYDNKINEMIDKQSQYIVKFGVLFLELL